MSWLNPTTEEQQKWEQKQNAERIQATAKSMKYLTLCIPLFLGCAASNNVTCPPPTQINTITYDTVRITTHDSVTLRDTTTLTVTITKVIGDTVTLPIPAQNSKSVYELPLSSGLDDYANEQANLDTAIAHGYKEIHMGGVGYYLSHHLVIHSLTGGFLENIHFYMDGGNYFPKITVTNGQDCGINLIQCKGCTVENVTIAGQNTGLLNYSVAQVLSGDTSSFITNGVNASNNAPHAGFVVDGIKYGDSYDATQGGSTSVEFIHCRARYFTVGFCLQPGGYLQNGEIITIESCWVDYCRSAISTGQSQERTVRAIGFSTWGWTKTIFDCVNFGNGTSCPPIADGLNAAGCIRYLCEQGSWISNGLVVNNSHIESLWSLGGCLTGESNTLTLTDDWIALQTPPTYIYQGAKLSVNRGYLWQYGEPATPIAMNCYWADFDGATLDAIPAVSGVPTYTKCITASGQRFGDNLEVSSGKGPAELFTTTFLWMGNMSIRYNGGDADAGYNTVRTRIPGTGTQEYLIPQLILGDLTAGNDTVKNVVVEGNGKFVAPPMLYMPELPPGTTIISITDTTIVLSAAALVSEQNAAIISGNWHGVSVGIPPPLTVYRYGFKFGDEIINNRPDLYPGILSWLCVQSGVTGTARLPLFNSLK